MTYRLQLSKIALKDLDSHRKSGNKANLIKIKQLLNELLIHPETGTGQPEKLKHQLSGKYSRRINRKHRLIYEIDEDAMVVRVISAMAHYE